MLFLAHWQTCVWHAIARSGENTETGCRWTEDLEAKDPSFAGATVPSRADSPQ